jgi:hypothetical protein
MSLWERRKILIWGKTRPELSRTHKETVCTGGVFADTKAFVRLYPIPLRFLNDEQVFKKYQWIDADVKRPRRDSRPESYNIHPETIQVGDFIPTDKGDWSERAAWLLQPDHFFESVEALQAEREWKGTSIGMVKPDEVLDFPVYSYPDGEKAGWWVKYRSILEQQEFQFAPSDVLPVKRLSPPDFRFKIKFRSGDNIHEFSVFDWEIDALYFNCRKRGDTQEQARAKVVAKLERDVCGKEKDTYFFLGNIAAHPQIFTIVGLWYPKKQRVLQASLFDDWA